MEQPGRLVGRALSDGTESPLARLVFSFWGDGNTGIPFPIKKPRGYPRVGANAGLSSCLVVGRP
jgi:hypothetical protein